MARPRLFVVVKVQQQPFELAGVLSPALAAHQALDDFIGLIVIVVSTRLVEIRRIFMQRLWPRSHRPSHLDLQATRSLVTKLLPCGRLPASQLQGDKRTTGAK